MGLVVDLIVNILATIIGIFVVYLAFMPRVRSEPTVLSFHSRRTGFPGYNCVYENRGPLRMLNVEVTVWIRVPKNSTRSYTHYVPVPVDDAFRPVLRRGGVSSKPLLELGAIDWNNYPVEARPSSPRDLADLLRELDATLHLHVSATASIAQISRVHERAYSADDVAPLPAPSPSLPSVGET